MREGLHTFNCSQHGNVTLQKTGTEGGDSKLFYEHVIINGRCIFCNSSNDEGGCSSSKLFKRLQRKGNEDEVSSSETL